MREKVREAPIRNYVAAGILAVTTALLGLVVFLCADGWQEYQDSIIDNQKEQMLLTTEALCRNMDIFIRDAQSDLAVLSRLSQQSYMEGDFQDQLFRSYIREHDGFTTDILITGGSLDDVLYSAQNTAIEEIFRHGSTDEGQVVQMRTGDGKLCLMLGQSCGEGRTLWLLVDLKDYFETLISDIRLGNNGYVLVKNSQGLILMHPDSQQYGIDVIDDRKKLYPGVDLTSLEQLIDAQLEGGSGVMEYDSYWWMDPQLPRVHKVAAWAPVPIGEDFLVISSVMDHSDIDIPTADSITRMGSAALLLAVAVLALSTYLVKLLHDRRLSLQEITHLKERGTLLEQLHRSQEAIAHQQRLQIVGTMTGGIAHEFNNLLTPILGHADLMLMELSEDSPLWESAVEISDAAARCKEIIQQLSALSRKNVEAAYRLLPADAVINRVMKMVQSACPSNVQIITRVELENVMILGNETQLQQVILNICVNAFQAIGSGEGTLTITAAVLSPRQQQAMEMLTEQQREIPHLSLVFTDTGCGMSSATLEQIFDPFFTTKKMGQGTGLGLALAQQIIQAHHGIIYAQSALGQGSSFYLLLPVSGSQTTEAVTPVRHTGGVLSILLTGENPKVLEPLAAGLREKEVRVATCSWNEVEGQLAQNNFQVLVMDCGQQQDTVLSLCTHLKESGSRIPRLLLATKLTMETAQARQQGLLQQVLLQPVSDQEVFLEAQKLSKML